MNFYVLYMIFIINQVLLYLEVGMFEMFTCLIFIFTFISAEYSHNIIFVNFNNKLCLINIHNNFTACGVYFNGLTVFRGIPFLNSLNLKPSVWF